MVLIDIICPSFNLKLPDDGNGLKINYALKEFLDEAEQSVSKLIHHSLRVSKLLVSLNFQCFNSWVIFVYKNNKYISMKRTCEFFITPFQSDFIDNVVRLFPLQTGNLMLQDHENWSDLKERATEEIDNR